MEVQLTEPTQQRLRQLLQRQVRQPLTDLLLQTVEPLQHVGRLQRGLVFHGNPQRGLKQRRWRLFQAGKAGSAWGHHILPGSLAL